MKHKKNSVRDYNLSDGLLKQKADSVVLCVLRDIALFILRGVTNATVDAFKALIEAFDNTPTDEVLQGNVSVATENKERSAYQLRIAIRTIRTMAENKWGTNSAHYRSYAFEGMDALSDEQLHRLAKRVIQVATQQMADLAGEGLTPAIIANLEALDISFDNDIDLQLSAIKERDIKTQERIDKGNVVYKEMVRLCNTGKDIFASTDEAKYNDYIIYNTPSGTPPPEEMLSGSIHGRVTDAITDDPLAFVQLKFEGIAEPTETDEEGDFEIEQVPLSCKTLTAEIFGYEKFTGNITIISGDEITYDFMMNPVETPPPPLVEE